MYVFTSIPSKILKFSTIKRNQLKDIKPIKTLRIGTKTIAVERCQQSFKKMES